jgi:uncharacterized membrane protein (UPF0182 family)
MYGRYHINDAGSFYEQTDRWSVAQDPGNTVETGGTTQTTDESGRLGPSAEERIDPYYLLMRLPGQEAEEFVLLRPFVPFSENDNRNELTSFMVAKSDPGEYGKLVVYEMPRGSLPDGPAIVASNINSDDEIAQRVSLLDDQGSQVRYGNLLVIPVEQSLLYVRPLYVQAQGRTAVPELRNVIVAFGDEIVMERTLQDALETIFGEAPPTQEETPGAGEEPEPSEPGEGEGEQPSVQEEQRRLIGEIVRAYDEANDALREGDTVTHAEKIKEAEELTRELDRLLAPDDEPTTTTTEPDEA